MYDKCKNDACMRCANVNRGEVKSLNVVSMATNIIVIHSLYARILQDNGQFGVCTLSFLCVK